MTSTRNFRQSRDASQCWWASIVLAVIFFSNSPVITAAEIPPIKTSGSYKYPESNVIVTIEEPQASSLTVRLAFDSPEFNGSTGTGKGSFMKVIAGRWAAQFVPPHQLWVYDGAALIRLYERTVIPSGFKASDSTRREELMKIAPNSIKEAMKTKASTLE